MFKQLKKRFFALIQLSQYKFILTTYLPGHSHPKVTLLLDQRFSVEFPTNEGTIYINKYYCSVRIASIKVWNKFMQYEIRESTNWPQ